MREGGDIICTSTLHRSSIYYCQFICIHGIPIFVVFVGASKPRNLNVRRKMTIWFPFGSKQGFDNTNVCSHVGNSTLLHDVIVMHVLWI